MKKKEINTVNEINTVTGKETVNKKEIEKDALATMIGEPLKFTIANKEFECPPLTFGKMQVLCKELLDLDFNEKELQKQPLKEGLRICKDKTDGVCRFLAIATLNTKDDLLNETKITEVADWVKWNSNMYELIPVTLKLITELDCTNFIHSIALMQTLNLNKHSETPQAVE